MLDLGLRVDKIGKSSVTYEVGVFEHQEAEEGADVDGPSAVGGYTHVFVDNETRKSSEMSKQIKEGLQRLCTTIKHVDPKAKARL